jgi:hypothetical protein
VRARHPHLRDRDPQHPRRLGGAGRPGHLAPAGDRRPVARQRSPRPDRPLSRAAIGVGADGIIVDVHPQPEEALVDGPQALAGADLRELAQAVRVLPPLLGRSPA